MTCNNLRKSVTLKMLFTLTMKVDVSQERPSIAKLADLSVPPTPLTAKIR